MTTPSRPELWGVLNVTPDSFSDGGLFTDSQRALEHARELVDQGASVVDVGGESTRPGATRVSAEDEISRVIPVVAALSSAGVRVSVDTMRATTARAAIDAGAGIINDVSGGLADPDMFALIADSDANYVMMHWRGHSDTMDDRAHYDDVVAEVAQEVTARVNLAVEFGISADQILLDPGLGFAKTPAHNWQRLRNLSDAIPGPSRVVVGASRKRFLGEVVSGEHEPRDRDGVSAALGVLLADQGVFALRVHNVTAHREALDVWQAFREGGTS